jgi:hypothetical protein
MSFHTSDLKSRFTGLFTKLHPPRLLASNKV